MRYSIGGRSGRRTCPMASGPLMGRVAVHRPEGARACGRSQYRGRRMTTSPRLQPASAPDVQRSASLPRTLRPVHVLVVERDPMARLGLQQVLGTGTDLQVVGSVSTIQDAEHLR